MPSVPVCSEKKFQGVFSYLIPTRCNHPILMFLSRRYIRCLIYLFFIFLTLFIITRCLVLIRGLLYPTDVNDSNISPSDAEDSKNMPEDKVHWKQFDAARYIAVKALRPGEDAYAKNKFNQKSSESISVYRDLPDVRHTQCRQVLYDSDLPDTSVIITFYNEARSTLIRTVMSVFRQTPAAFLKEIILVDDYSSDPSDARDLERIHKVRVHRNTKREGLIRSRVYGARLATAQTLTFLDSHVECNKHWLEPLLQEIKRDPNVYVVSPLIDIIDMNSFDYIAASPNSKGGFEWTLTFKWADLTPQDETLRHNVPINPIRTPVIAGGLFTISRERFFQLGAYDMGMDVWGGENLEFSFRVWMCHSVLEIVPCSRVGHVFRQTHPYDFPGGGSGVVFVRNNHRMAEVWLDEYKEIYYSRVPYALKVPEGDVEDRRQLRSKLQCHNFTWYLHNVYPDMEVPSTFAMHTYTFSLSDGRCLDSLEHYVGQSPGFYPCHNTKGGNQEWKWTFYNQLSHGEMCLQPITPAEEAAVLFQTCKHTDPMQQWELLPTTSGSTQVVRLRLKNTRLCLDSRSLETPKVGMRPCDDRAAATQNLIVKELSRH